MTSATNLGSLVPGFDFLQGLMKTGGTAMPGIGQWIAPTLDPAELQKRIDELRTVQFWLEQNSKLLGTTIQALEVQRMTLATLKGMNVPVADLAGALTLGRGSDTAARSGAAKPSSATAKGADTPGLSVKGSAKSRSDVGGGASGAGVDAMQWWGALTKQFTELAAGGVGSLDHLADGITRAGDEPGSEFIFQLAAGTP